VTADESDSPRGRIVMMRALERGELAADDPELMNHLDRCLGCRACESVCPAGVVFGPALEAARAEIAKTRPLPAAVRAGLWLLARPGRQRLLWAVSRALRGTGLPRVLARGAGGDAPPFVGMLAMLAATRPNGQTAPGHATQGRASSLPSHGRSAGDTAPEPPGASGPGDAARDVALFRGCVMDGLFSHVHDATIRTLAVNGVATREVRGQVCCGALAAHAGDDDLARELARENVRAFDAGAPGIPVVTNSAGCGAMLKAYGEWLAGHPLEARGRAFATRVLDVSELLAARGPKRGRPLPLRVAYDAPCHLLHAQRVAAAPRALLDAIPDLVQVPLEGSERCCGSAGLYALAEPELSREVLGAKLAAIVAARPDVVVTGNPGCLMQIGAGALVHGLDVDVRHPVELLDWSYGP
jgi:glycolate oxidase iron-sulfur subunit